MTNRDTDTNVLEIKFTPEAWAKMWAYTYSVKEEISGYGKVEVQDGVFTVTDVAIFKQTVSGADTTIDAASVAAFMYELHKRGEDATKWQLWWHSHNVMNVFWSGTDEIAMSPENNIGRDWLLSVVVNFKRETKGRLDIFNPTHVTVDDIPVSSSEVFAIPQSITEEVKAKVTRRALPMIPTGGKWGAGYNTGKTSVMGHEYGGYYDDGMYTHDDVPPVQLPFSRSIDGDLQFEDIAYGLDDVMSEEEYELCKRYYENPDKLNHKQRKVAKKLLEDWGVNLKHNDKYAN